MAMLMQKLFGLHRGRTRTHMLANFARLSGLKRGLLSKVLMFHCAGGKYINIVARLLCNPHSRYVVQVHPVQ